MGKQVTSREAIKEVEAKGWTLDRINGSHHTFKKAGEPMLITIPHPSRHLSPGVVRDIEKKAGVRF
jgi:predicted RNA binding protein YcfA (HicA-like mRNA interferase family)